MSTSTCSLKGLFLEDLHWVGSLGMGIVNKGENREKGVNTAPST